MLDLRNAATRCSRSAPGWVALAAMGWMILCQASSIDAGHAEHGGAAAVPSGHHHSADADGHGEFATAHCGDLEFTKPSPSAIQPAVVHFSAALPAVAGIAGLGQAAWVGHAQIRFALPSPGYNRSPVAEHVLIRI